MFFFLRSTYFSTGFLDEAEISSVEGDLRLRSKGEGVQDETILSLEVDRGEGIDISADVEGDKQGDDIDIILEGVSISNMPSLEGSFKGSGSSGKVSEEKREESIRTERSVN